MVVGMNNGLKHLVEQMEKVVLQFNKQLMGDMLSLVLQLLLEMEVLIFT
jgi:hypothetical protein